MTFNTFKVGSALKMENKSRKIIILTTMKFVIGIDVYVDT